MIMCLMCDTPAVVATLDKPDVPDVLESYQRIDTISLASFLVNIYFIFF